MHGPAPEPDPPDLAPAPALGEPVGRYQAKPFSHPSRLHRPAPWLLRLLLAPVPADLMHATAADPSSRLRPSHADLLIRAIAERRYQAERRGRVEARTASLNPDAHDTYDFLFASPGEPNLPADIFKRLRWGGVFACVGDSATRLMRLAESFANHPGFHVETPVSAAHVSRFGVRIPGLTPSGLFFAARKTQLILPGQLTERFTYDVELMPPPRAAAPRRRFTDAPNAGYTVVKRVPEEQALLARLRHRFPAASADDLAARAHKFVDHVFPTFLTREAAFLKILERDLPEAYRNRVPRLLAAEKDDRGFVRKLTMNWLRTGTRPIGQLEFARQAAELLAVIHDRAKVMHLDLRLDNFVLTDDGVGFVDFGSAVRIGEDLTESPMLTSLFGEMMRTSQIQRMLGRMIETGDVHNPALTAAHQKVSPALDSYYLAVQINRPRHNPLFAHLVQHDKDSPQAKALAQLTAAVLRPKADDKAEYKTAADILRGIARIERKLGTYTGTANPARTAA
ncbi:MAG: hypothetical protein AAF823_04005 [Planctomycetota bacterium]